MGDTRRSYDEFAGRLRDVVQRMAEDGIPQEQIGAFIERQKAQWSEQQNAARADRMQAAEDENTAGAAVKRGLSEWGGNLKDRLVAMAKGGAQVAWHPVDTYRNIRDVPEARREFGRGLSDVMFGLPAYLGDKLGVTHYAETAPHDASVADQPQVQNMRGAGSMAGTVAMLPAGVPLKAGMAALPGSMATKALLAPVAMSTVGGAIHGAVDPQEHVLPRRNPDGSIDPGTMLAGATDPMNLAIPAVVGAAAKTSQLLRRNPTIGRYARAKTAGAYDSPDMKALAPGQEGMQQAAEQGLERIVNRDRELAQQASRAYQQAVEPELTRPIDTEAMRMRLLEGRQANIDPDSGLPIRPEVDTAYNRAFDNTPEQATVRGTLMRRRGLQQDASFGSPSPTEAQNAARDVYQTFRQAVRQASPAVAAADDSYTAHARQAARRSDILFNTEENVIPNGGGSGAPDARVIDADPSVPTGAAAALEGPADMRVSKARSAATTLSRVDDTNVPGLRAARFLEELAGQDPAFAQALNFIANKKALEGTRFGLPQLPTSLTGATSFAGKLPFAQQNLRALGARIVDPVANSVGRGAGPALTLNPVMQAFQAEQERKRRMAESLLGGGR